MNEISCGVCMDLMPLVSDGIAGEESVQAVEEHIKTCEGCRSHYEEKTVPPTDPGKAFGEVKRRLKGFLGMIMVFGILFGLGLTEGSGIFFNIILMPVMGAIGYFIFGWNALWEVSVLIFSMRIVINALPLIQGSEKLNFGSVLEWSAIYAAFALAGAVIAGLVHFAFRKEEN